VLNAPILAARLRIGWVAAAAVSFPAGAATPPAWQPTQADVCAVVAAADPYVATSPATSPPAPGSAAPGASARDPRAVAEAAKRRDAIRYSDRWHGLGWRYEGGVLSGTWGTCPLASLPFNTLSFSDDGRFAMTEWGGEPVPLGGEWGDCVFEKVAGRWQSLGCVTTAMS